MVTITEAFLINKVDIKIPFLEIFRKIMKYLQKYV